MNGTIRAAGRWTGAALIISHIVLTALHNLPDQHIDLQRFAPRLQRMLPNWRFFGPTPGSDDIFLFVRYRDEHGKASAWRRLVFATQRPWWSALWNAGNRVPKALFDVCQNIRRIAIASQGDASTITSCVAYGLLERYVVSCEKPHSMRAGDEVQFALLSSRPGISESDVESVLVSEFLPLKESPKWIA